MCDLIDLKSPDGKTVGPKLASPLIPAPSKTPGDEKSDTSSEPQSSSGLNFVKRTSLDNNPFDNALHKTAEYSRKQDDPFEVVLEKALKCKEQNIVLTPKARSVEFKDDFTPKKTRYSDILKMNKTLDDSLIEAQLVASDARRGESSPCPDDSIIHDLNNTNLLAESNDDNVVGKFRLKNNRLVPRLCVEAADTSILSQSAMNDSLTDSGDSSEEFLIKSIVAQRISMCIQKGTDDANYLAVQEIPKSHKLRRSLSQGDRLSPRKFRQHRSQSIVDSLKASMGNENDSSVCSTASIFFDDNMNKAFLQTRCASNVSGVSDLSNISAITRLASASSAYNSTNSSSAFSNRTANCAFIETSGNLSETKGVNEKINGRLLGMSRIHSTGSIAAIVESPQRDPRIKDDISDLLSKYSQLKLKSSDIEKPANRLPSVVSGSGILGRSASEKSNDKLIDVDVFVSKLEPSPPQDQPQRQSLSSTSSDSVFLDSNTVGRSILSEAKSLAKTFEELAGKTSGSSGSSNTDDLINSRPHWNFDLLPVSDDEAPVDNLIELPTSPAKGDSPQRQNAEDSARNEKLSSSSEPKSEKSILKELENEFIAPEKKIYATTLLMDLEKLVKSEGNPEAVQLLENLEKALGVKCESNAELLASCFAEKNNLTKSPRRSESALATENIRNESNEKSCEDNADVVSSESLKELSLSEKSLQNNLNNQKEINKSDKSLVLVNERFDHSDSNSLSESSASLEQQDSSGKLHDDSIAAIKQKNHIDEDQKMALEILRGLGKLLSGENKDPMTANLLKNLGMALNLASSSTNNVIFNGSQQTDPKESKRVDTPVKKQRVATPPRKPASLSAFSRSASSRRSLESSTKSKAAAERAMRRSTSVTHTPTTTTPRIQNAAFSVDKSKAHLKEVKKRFPSDPGSTNSSIEKKREIQATNNRRSSKDISLKPVAVSELARQEKPSSTVAEAVKSKLRKKADSDGSNKRGPMKAFLPLGNMQRRGSIGKRVSPLTGSVTPPKPNREAPSDFTVTTSTPFPTVHLSCPKKSPKTKPMASSTPDAVGPKNTRRSAPILPSPGKNTLSCNISPVTSKTGEDIDDKDILKSSKISKICTPSKSRSGSQLPKLSPMQGMKNSPTNLSRGQRRSEPLQSFLPRSLNPPKSPSIRVTEASTSPLNNSNKLGSKVKPLNLISKLRRRSASVAEKENYA